MGEDRTYRVVARSGSAGYRTEIEAGGHTLVADEPAGSGGGGEGPSPYDLLVSALGACTAMTLRMYADRKKWPLESVVVNLRHNQSHADDERHCDTAPARLDRIERTVVLLGPLTDEQRTRLLEIADRCPVHRTLDAGVNIVAVQ